MSILAAVFANAWRISLDVSGIVRCPIEGWGEEQNEAVFSAHQLLVHRRHGACAAAGIGGAREHTPGLSDRVNTAFTALGRAERSAVVEITAPIPAAVPPLSLQGTPQANSVLAPNHGASRFAALLCQWRECRERGVKEPAEPDAFAFTFFPDPIHPVIPVSGPDQGQAVTADRKALVKSQSAMLEESGAFLGGHGLEE